MKQLLRAVSAVFIMIFIFSAVAETAEDITSRCTITANPKSNIGKAQDGRLDTYWTSKGSGTCIKISAPNDGEIGAIGIEWFIVPSWFTIEQYDSELTLIKTTTQEDYPYTLSGYFTLEESTRNVRLLVPEKTKVAGIKVYSPGEPEKDVQIWEDTVSKADIMFIATHQDDELLWFGGGIPYYATAMDCDTVVMYSCTCGRKRKGEALAGLWTMGVTNFPVFLNLKDTGNKSQKEVLKAWGGKDKVIGMMVEAIRKYKPEVIITQDVNGEYGHMNHKMTVACVAEAVKAAGDATKYKASAEKYGAWDVKKCYVHLGSENVIYMDWETHLDELNGYSPIELATMGFEKHASQHGNWSMQKGKKYDNTKFSLVWSLVGEDVYKDDFLENTPADLRLNGKK